MDIEDLRTFVEVADAGGVSPAARRLGVSKSIVSRRLFRLEAELGVQLLARTTRGAGLTEAGVTFVTGMRPPPRDRAIDLRYSLA
jgi:DNA-binding transcriptional LysR family regulator